MSIEISHNKSIVKNKHTFNELKILFYANVEQLKFLDVHSQRYYDLYYENESIIDLILNKIKP